MTLTTALYLCGFLDALDVLLTIAFTVLLVLFLVSGIGWIFCQDEYVDRTGVFEGVWKSILKKWWVLAIVCTLVAAIPSQSTMYIMLGASYLNHSNLPTKVEKALELKLDYYIDSLTKRIE